MAQRRASTTASAKPNLGEPYQIYTEIVDIGKTVQGSKRKIKWLFGFSDSNKESEVVLIHSLVSGKKTIFEDGKEIVQSSNVLATDFSHGWTSWQCHRIYRIEASLGLATEHLYKFSIDGVSFLDMARQPTAGNKNSSVSGSTGRYADEHEVDNRYSAGSAPPPSRRASTGSAAGGTAAAAAARSGFQSPAAPTATKSNASTFDPFESNDSFDPFGDKTSTNNKPTSASKSASSSTSKAAAQQSSTSLFDEFDSGSVGTRGGGGGSSVGADPFASTSSSSVPFDPFGSTTDHGNARKNQSVDPFAASSSLPQSNASKSAGANYAATVGSSSSNQSKAAASHSQPDLLSIGNDLPAAGSGGAAAVKPSRRSSAAEIQMDFAGLAFVAAAAPAAQAPPSQQQQSSNLFDAPSTEETAAELVPDAASIKDPWHATNLVDLDLSGRNAKQQQQQQSRGSISNQAPSLDNLMGKPTARRTSIGTGAPINVEALTAPPQAPAPASIDPWGAPSLLVAGNQFVPTPPQQQQQQQFNQFQPTSSAMGGMQQQPMGGRPMGGMQQQQAGGGMNAMNRAPPVNPFGGNVSMGGAGMGGMQQRGSITGSYGMNNGIPNPTKPAPNSLDTLNWKN